jgi:hypothetical protein
MASTFAALAAICLSTPPPAAGQSQSTAAGPHYESTANAETVPGYTSMAIAPDGKVHIACAGKYLSYVVRDGEGWRKQEVESQGAYSDCSLALDSSGCPAISYHDFTKRDLKYARLNGTSWDVETVDSQDIVGQFTSLAFDDSDRPAISYYKGSYDYDQRYAHWNGTSWDVETPDGPGTVG